jgi:hypothetical protein
MLKTIKLTIFVFLTAILIQSSLASELDLNPFLLPSENGIQSGEYIVPNEEQTHLYKREIENISGILVSVGTFRTLFNAVMGDFSHIVMLDYDELATRFNYWNLNLIYKLQESGLDSEMQRYTYLSILYNRLPESRFLWTLSHLKRDDYSKLNQLLSELEENSPKLDVSLLPPEIQESAGAIIDIFQHRSVMTGRSLEDNFNKPFIDMRLALSLLNEDEDASAVCYWKTDANRTKLQTLIVDNKITVIQGSISGSQTLLHLSNVLEKKQGIAVLDLSNALEYVLTQEDTSRQFAENLSRLPFTRDARLFFTVHTRAKPFLFLSPEHGRTIVKFSSQDGWNYFSVNYSSISDRILEHFSGETGYFRFVENLLPLQIL